MEKNYLEHIIRLFKGEYYLQKNKILLARGKHYENEFKFYLNYQRKILRYNQSKNSLETFVKLSEKLIADLNTFCLSRYQIQKLDDLTKKKLSLIR